MYKAFANCLHCSSSAYSKIWENPPLITPYVGGSVFSGGGLWSRNRPTKKFHCKIENWTAIKITPTEKQPKVMIQPHIVTNLKPPSLMLHQKKCTFYFIFSRGTRFFV